MYFNYLTGIESSEGDPVNFVEDVIENSINLWEQDKIANNIPQDIKIPDYIGHFLDKRYSTRPHKSQVRPEELYELCYTESNMLRQIVLHYHGMVLTIIKSNFQSPYKYNPFQHYYLSTNVGKTEVIVEPTLGQFILDYKGIFVGTREDLKNLFLLKLKTDPYIFNSQWLWARELLDETPEQMFNVIWGNKSINA